MSLIIRVLVLAAVAFTVAGCGANFGSIFRSYETLDGEKAKSVIIDAKQRAILAAPARDVVPDAHKRTRDVIVCAEPSPDALSAISSTFAGSFGGIFGPSSKAEVALASAFTETASQLGTRNATIQLLRDGLYRQCEAYMNGLIKREYYEQIANKYVNAMVTLLAIEELTPSKATATKITAGEGAKVSTKTEVNVTQPAPTPSEETPETEEADEEDDEEEAEDDQGEPDSATADAEAPAPTVNVNLPDETTAVPNHVSTAVKTMVTWFLTKDTVDYCLRGLFSGATGGESKLQVAFIEVCQRIILQQMAGQRELLGTAVAEAEGFSFGPDDCSAALKSLWKPGGVFDDENEAKIRGAMSDAHIAGPITTVVNAKERAEDRRIVGAALNLPDCQ